MLPSARSIGLVLEWSCHGVSWFIFAVAWLLGLVVSLLSFSSISPYASSASYDPYISDVFQSRRNVHNWRPISLLFALTMDVIVVGLLKFLVKRPRPETNYGEDMLLTVSIDDWSFPSGHSSRAGLLQWLLAWLFFDMSSRTRLLIGLWAVSVCVSRLLLRRHHLGDVVFGYCLGCVEYWLVARISWAYWFSFLG